MQTVAITGATGYVGRFVTAELLRRGLAVRALVRSASDRRGFAQAPEWVEGSLTSDAALTQLVTGVDAVAHLAYEHIPGRYRGGEGDDLAGWLDANLNGSLRLLMAARAAGVKRFIFLSSRAVFSRTEPGRALDEAHPLSPDSHYGAYKAAVEMFLKSFAHRGDMQTCSVRATGVYGITWPPERSKWWGLVQAVLNDEPITSVGGGTEVYGGDVARVIGHLLTADIAGVEAVHLSDLYITHRDVVQLARKLAGRPGPLPLAPSAAPENVLVSRVLPQLGISLGGAAQFEAIIAQMLQAAS